MAGFYADDAIFLPPGAPIAVGRAAIQAAQQRMLESGVQALELEAMKVIETGEFAVEVGRVIVTIQPPGASASMTEMGKSVVVWRREGNGTLKILVDTFNSDRRAGI
jgi:ketosteroid isomerase-like protein